MISSGQWYLTSPAVPLSRGSCCVHGQLVQVSSQGRGRFPRDFNGLLHRPNAVRFEPTKKTRRA